MSFRQTLKGISLAPILVASLLAASPVFAAAVEAKKDGVEIYTEATNKSAVLGKMGKGEALPSVERKGMFWQVKLKDGKTGFVSVLAVGHKPDSGGDLAKAIKTVVKEGRSTDDGSETRARSAVMGVRGLREDDNAGNAGQVRPNLRAVYAMEDRTIQPKKLEQLSEAVFAEIAAKADSNQ